MKWIPITQRFPDSSRYVLLSFENFSIPMVGRYEEDEEGGAFYVGDDFEAHLEEDVQLQLKLALNLELTITTPLPDVKPEGSGDGGFNAKVDDWGDEENIDINM
jgi:hypothetical protein